jgi:hypothetical protein
VVAKGHSALALEQENERSCFRFLAPSLDAKPNSDWVLS